MEIKNEYKILELEGNIVLKQESWKTMDLKEAHKELLGLRNHIIQLEGKRKQIEKQIEDKFLDKQIEEITENETKTKDLEEKWSELITPVLEELKKKLKRKVKDEKIKRGYERVSDTAQKITMQNQILGPIVEELELDMADPIVKEIKGGFDKI